MLGYVSVIKNLSFTSERLVRKRQREEKMRHLEELKHSIEYTKVEINEAMRSFDSVTEQGLVDFYIYKIRAEQCRYEHLLNEYRQQKAQFDSEL